MQIIDRAIEFIPKTDRPDTKVIVGMSGGVDSSVSAYLLKEAGFRVEGLFMKNWDEDDGTEYCTAKADLEDCLQVSKQLDIPLHTANFASEYWDNVFEHFLQEYEAGRTPNPDVLCNREIKFKVFLDYAKILGADYIATGHYSRIIRNENEIHLYKGIDPNKDQSYFLHSLSSQQLSQAIFPLGDLHKDEIRKIASKIRLPNAQKKDSTGICFIGERRFKSFLATYLPAKPGQIKTIDGKAIGTHQGLMYYTIGQRQGLGIGGVCNTEDSPWYVAKKRLEDNVLIVVQGNNHPSLFKPALTTGPIHWINDIKGKNWQGTAKCRYRQRDQACVLEDVGEQGALVRFTNPQRAITPGQYLVLYDGERCLGGAIIESGEDETETTPGNALEAFNTD